MQPFEWNHIPALFYDNVVRFLLPKCVCFLPMVFVMFSIRTLCFYVFCKTVLVKNYTPCQGMGVIYFLVCVRKHKSNLLTNICTTLGKKTQWYVEKCNLLSETTFLPYFMTAWCVFFYQRVCFFYQWCLSCFSSPYYVSMIFVKQCW